MPSPLKVQPHLSIEELRRRSERIQEAKLRSHYQMILMVAEGKSVSQAASALGFARQWVARIVHRYNEGGPKALGDKRHQNMGRPPMLDAPLRERLRQMLANPPDGGGEWTGPLVARWLEGELEHPIHVQRVYEWAEQIGHPIGRRVIGEE